MCDGIAHLHLARCLDTRNDVTHITCTQLLTWAKVHLQHTNFVGIVLLTGIEELHLVALAQNAVGNLEICDDTTERVKHRVKDKRLQRSLFVAHRSGNALNNSIQDILYTKTGLARSFNDILSIATDEVDNLILNLLGHGIYHVALVHHRNNLQSVVNSHVEVRDSLRLHTLCGIHNQKSTLASCY